jgi:hypothetical protein
MSNRKIHLRRNKNPEIMEVAACATNPYSQKIFRNQRTSYQSMSSEIVSWEAFKATPADERCAHCVEAALVIRNRQRKAKGLPPVETPFDLTTDGN